MSVLRFIVKKEFLQLRRDRRMLPIVILAPVLQLVLLGYAANLDVRHLSTAVYDQDDTSLSRGLTESFLSSEYFDLALRAVDLDEVETALLSGRADIALVIPADFGRSILRGETPQLQLLVDGADSTVGTAAMNYAKGIVETWLHEVGREETAGRRRLPPIQIHPRVWYNPELESRNFMVPGILALLLMVITMLLSSLAIVKERELGTLEQLNVTPIRPRELIIGKLIPFVIIGLVDVTLVVLVSRFLFAVPLRGSVPLLYLMSVIFLATTLGLGLLISTVSENQQQAMMTAVFFVMVPMTFLSGFAFPIESMPRSIQYFTYLIPLRYYFVIIRGIFLKGAGLSVLWQEALALLASGLVILAVAAARFRKRAG